MSQGDGQLSVGESGVPVAPAEVSLAQMSQALSRIRRRQPDAPPCHGDTKVSDSPRQVVNVEPQHSSHDEDVELGHGSVVPRDGKKPEHSQPLGAPIGGGQGICLCHSCHRPPRRIRRGGADCPAGPHECQFGPTGDDHPVGERGCGLPSDFRLSILVMRLPGSEQAAFGTGRTGEHPQQPGQRVTARAGDLAGSEGSCRRRGVGGVEVEPGGIQEPALPVFAGRRKQGGLFDSPGRSVSIADGGARESRGFEFVRQRLLWTD